MAKTFVILIWFIAGLILTRQSKMPAEKIHVLEFGMLGWFSANDMIKIIRKTAAVILACFFCIGIGILDELFQGVLPYRTFEVRDIIFNGLGGIWGVILYLLKSG